MFNPRSWSAIRHGDVMQENTTLELTHLKPDPHSIVVFISGGCAWSEQYQHIQAVFGISSAPNSFRNIASYVPRNFSQSKEVAELFAISGTLRHILEIVVTNQFVFPITSVVLCTCLPEVQKVMTNPIWSRIRPDLWKSSWGIKALLRDVLERVAQLESFGLEMVFIWTPVYVCAQSYQLMPPVF